MIKLTTSARFIGELLDDLNLSSGDYIDRLYAWIEYGLGMMNLAKYYTLKSTPVDIINHRGILPCDAQFIHSLWTMDLGASDIRGLRYVQVSTSHLAGKQLKGYPISNNKISIDGYYIHSDAPKGKVIIVYRAIPRDDNGYPMIPDNPFVFEALNFYIIYRLALRGIEHPIIKFKDALQLWNDAYPRASNDVNWMTPSEYEEFTMFWNSPYMGNMVKQHYIS